MTDVRASLVAARQIHVNMLEAINRGEAEKVRARYERWVVSIEGQEKCVADYDLWLEGWDVREDALRRIAWNDPPEGAESWGSGKSWRIELARSVVALGPGE